MPKRREYPGLAPLFADSATVEPGAVVGLDSVIGRNCHVARGAVIGRGCRIQFGTAVFSGVTLGDRVFVGPNATFTNIRTPRAEFLRAPDWDRTLVEEGATLGAGAVLVAPVRIGRYAVVAAGAVVTKDVDAFAMVAGNPARVIGSACVCGVRLREGRCPMCEA